jgi:6-phosphogluconolactonase
VPLFHLTLLGLGDDGHTASLLPGQPVLNERSRWAAAVPQGRAEPRITLTYPALESSALILFLVAGAGKRDALAQARGGIGPAGGIKPRGEVLWLVDEAAAGEEDQGYGF